MKKRSKSKEAKFFCESCGSEVPRNSKVCPTCGKFFASVRCPQCGRIGDNEDFKNGCPTCGYAVNPDGELTRGSYGIGGAFGKGKANAGRGYGKRGLLGLGRKAGSVTGGYVESGLPFWIYLVSLMILAALVVGLYSCL